MLKRILILSALVVGFTLSAAPDANAWVVRRVAPVRRTVARVALPPYPVARRVVARPIYRPYVYRAPVVYGPGVGVYVW